MYTGSKQHLRVEGEQGMQQRDLFNVDKAGRSEADNDDTARYAIRSGRVGVIRFGATDASYALTRDVLTDLAAPPPRAAEEPS